MTFDSEAASLLPENILFGTSSWNYEGWKGTIYKREYKSEKAFSQESLSEYAHFPWFRTVGIDASFYGPLHGPTLERYASQLPAGFRWVSKVWEEISVPFFGKHPRYGPRAGKENPHFLNAELFCERVLKPLEAPHIFRHVGPLVFQFQSMPLQHHDAQERFLRKLDKFFTDLPTQFQYACEIRNQELLSQHYFDLINHFGVAHCFNHWTSMPPLVQQMKSAAAAGSLKANFFIARLLTPLGVKYEDAVKLYAPYNSLKAPIESAREDAVRLILRGIERQISTYILVNNRLEGHAPSTIDAIGRMAVAALHLR